MKEPKEYGLYEFAGEAGWDDWALVREYLKDGTLESATRVIEADAYDNQLADTAALRGVVGSLLVAFDPIELSDEATKEEMLAVLRVIVHMAKRVFKETGE